MTTNEKIKRIIKNLEEMKEWTDDRWTKNGLDESGSIKRASDTAYDYAISIIKVWFDDEKGE